MHGGGSSVGAECAKDFTLNNNLAELSFREIVGEGNSFVKDCGEPSIYAISQRCCELAHLAMRAAKLDELVHA